MSSRPPPPPPPSADLCPDDATRFTLLDEPDLVPASVKEHVASCARCGRALDELRDLIGDVRAADAGALGHAADADARVARLDAALEQLEEGEAPARLRARRPPAAGGRRALAAAAFAAVAAAAGLALVPRTSDAPPAFTARGTSREGGLGGLDRVVDVSLDVVDATNTRATALVPAEGARASRRARLLLATTLRSPAAAHLLCFAVDAAGEVRWLWPAWTEPSDDPRSVEVASSERPVAQPTEASLDDFPEGRTQVVALFAAAPLRVSAIESLPPAELAPARLAARFPEAAVRTWTFEVSTADGPVDGPEGGRK